MIYYFSGTGNSQWVAEQLAKETHDETANIGTLTKDGATSVIAGENSMVGLVFPIYAWAPPAIVMDFAKHIQVEKGAFAYAVCTCGDDAGKAMQKLKRVYPLKSAYSIVMPNNYIPMYDVDDPQQIKDKVSAATVRIPLIAKQICAHKEIIDVREGGMAALKTTLVSPLFNCFAMTAKPFTVDNTCNGCGLCERNCPLNVIEIVNGKPVWRGKCQQCLSCIHRCPKNAIQYGNTTRKKRRYYFHAK
ncbi:MAG: EFR1 family ferrodoxin [Clostridia bacterium]